MITKKEILLFGAFFIFGILGSWKFFSYQKAINNSPERVAWATGALVQQQFASGLCIEVIGGVSGYF